jgi:hypothetical protein
MYKTPEEVREAVRRAVRFGESFPLPKAERLTAQNVSALQATGGGRINRIDVRQFIAGKTGEAGPPRLIFNRLGNRVVEEAVEGVKLVVVDHLVHGVSQPE